MNSKYYTNLAANATTVIQPGAGRLHSIVINTIGVTGNVCTVYDNTAGSGTIIATIDTTIAAAPTRIFDIEFKTGLTVVIATGTAANITVTWT